MQGEEPEIKIEYYEDDARDPLACRPRTSPAPALDRLQEHSGGDEFQPISPLAPVTTSTPLATQLSTKIPATKPLTYTKLTESTRPKETWYKTINKNGKMLCKFCELDYSSVQTLRYHVVKKHPIEAETLKEAISKSTDSQRFYCHLCREKFESLQLLKGHANNHNMFDSRRFVCHYCNSVFESKECVQKHIYLKHCDKKGNFFNKITSKIKMNSEKKFFSCPHCTYVAKRNYGLTMHIKARHRTEDDYIFQCQLCPYKTSIKYYLQNHIAANHPQCDFAYTKNVFICDTCGYRTPKKSHYLIHKNLHLPNSKKLKCDFCDYVTHLSPNLEVHKRTHTKEKPYFCDFDGCDYRCGSKTALNSHKLKHFPEKYYLYCDKCNYKSVYRSSLRKHLGAHARNGRILQNL